MRWTSTSPHAWQLRSWFGVLAGRLSAGLPLAPSPNSVSEDTRCAHRGVQRPVTDGGSHGRDVVSRMLWPEARIVVRAATLDEMEWTDLRRRVSRVLEGLGRAPTELERRIYDAVKKLGGPPRGGPRHAFWSAKFWENILPTGVDCRSKARLYLDAVEAIEGPAARAKLEATFQKRRPRQHARNEATRRR